MSLTGQTGNTSEANEAVSSEQRNRPTQVTNEISTSDDGEMELNRLTTYLMNHREHAFYRLLDSVLDRASENEQTSNNSFIEYIHKEIFQWDTIKLVSGINLLLHIILFVPICILVGVIKFETAINNLKYKHTFAGIAKLILVTLKAMNVGSRFAIVVFLVLFSFLLSTCLIVCFIHSLNYMMGRRPKAKSRGTTP